jgi:cell division septation protein DedD
VPNCETFLAGRPTPAAPLPAADSARPTEPARAPATSAPATAAPAGAASAAATAPRPSVPRGGREFTVQIAAYDRRPGADELAASLTRRGYPARVSAQGPNADRPPFRVRIGRFATRDEALALLRELRGRKITGFLTEAEP